MNIEQKQKTLNDFYNNIIYTFIEEYIDGEAKPHHGFVTNSISETSYITTFFDVFLKREISIIIDCMRIIAISDFRKIPEKEARIIYESWRCGK